MTDFVDFSSPVEPGEFNLGGQGVTLVAAGPTRTQLRASQKVKQVSVKARKANVGTVYLGTVTVTADETPGTGGYQLSPGDMHTFPVLDIGTVYVVGAAGDGVSYLFWV